MVIFKHKWTFFLIVNWPYFKTYDIFGQFSFTYHVNTIWIFIFHKIFGCPPSPYRRNENCTKNCTCGTGLHKMLENSIFLLSCIISSIKFGPDSKKWLISFNLRCYHCCLLMRKYQKFKLKWTCRVSHDLDVASLTVFRGESFITETRWFITTIYFRKVHY